MAHDIRKLMSLLRLLKGRGGSRRVSWQAIVALLAVTAIYVLVRPTAERTLGLGLPHLIEWGVTGSPPVDNDLPEGTTSKKSAPPRSSPRSSKTVPMPSGEPALSSFLTQTSNNVFESPAGLVYRRGSAHGHRLKHIMAHAVDDPDRPGQHGVFDASDALEVFQLIDEAYEQALTGKRTKTEREGRRTVYCIDLKRKIGTIGGESGNRRGHPSARHLQLVLDGKNVITAYPVRR